MALCAQFPSLGLLNTHPACRMRIRSKQGSKILCQQSKIFPNLSQLSLSQHIRKGFEDLTHSGNTGSGLLKELSRKALTRGRLSPCGDTVQRVGVVCNSSSSQSVSSEPDIAPKELLSRFPWKELASKVTEKVESLLGSGIKWVAIPFFAIVLFAEFTYAWREGKALLFVIGIVTGSSLSTLLSEIYEEFATKAQVGGFPLHVAAIFLLFAALKAPGSAYPTAWLRVLCPAIGTGGLWKAALMLLESRRTTSIAK